MVHPMQEVVPGYNRYGPRFRPNAIVEYLLDRGPFDMNSLGIYGFPREDREQFAQLIGYSVSGFCELSYVSDEAAEAATKLADQVGSAPPLRTREPGRDYE